MVFLPKKFIKSIIKISPITSAISILHMVQLVPLPSQNPITSCIIKSRLVLSFWYPLTQDVLYQALNPFCISPYLTRATWKTKLCTNTTHWQQNADTVLCWEECPWRTCSLQLEHFHAPERPTFHPLNKSAHKLSQKFLMCTLSAKYYSTATYKSPYDTKTLLEINEKTFFAIWY